MRPFFYFYGGKYRLAPKYPAPRYKTLVEPFAGAAGYSTRHAGYDVILCDKDPIIVGVWSYLIRASENEILKLPDIGDGETVDDLSVPEEARWLIGFWLNTGSVQPKKTPSAWMRSGQASTSFWGDAVRSRIASQVDSIRHWKVYNCGYEDCSVHRSATWFIDPPYAAAGVHYRFGSSLIDYDHLANWCKTRPGQVIACENEGASWLPFGRFADSKSCMPGRWSKESVWLRDE